MTTLPRPFTPGSARAPFRFNAATLAWASLLPLLHRLRRGEGLLLLINVSLAAVAESEPRGLASQVLISTAVLALLYFLNDVHDCIGDRNDPAKDPSFVDFCIRNRPLLLRALALQKAGVLLLAFALLGPRSAAAVAAIFALNLGYSLAFKRMAGLDVPFVALWGAVYALVPGVDVPPRVIALVGVMTAICHVFQITRDRDVDLSNRVRTSAGVSPWLPEAELGFLCAALGFLLLPFVGPLGAASASTPFLFRRAVRSNAIAWLLSKAYFGMTWIVVLSRLHAS